LSAPLSPVAEQRRIVAKIDELMALCDRLEAARAEREDTRDKLTAASLARLNAPDPDTFRDDGRFALDALPALTARPDQIRQLRQTILNLAVRGKLVPQNPNDEPAITFDREIPADLKTLFDIPKSWNWSRLHALGKLKGGGTPSMARDDYWNGPIPWVSPKDMKVDYLAETQMNISEAAIAGSAAKFIEAGSVLFVVRGMILAHSFPVAVTRVPLAINQDMKALVLKKPEMAEFILRTLKGVKPGMLKRVQRSSHGTCRLEGSDYSDFLVPVPPLAEQHRIVAKVDELMALCDRLEASLTTADQTRRRLLDALLAEALAPAETLECQAAE
jgi:type I restriction enzyme S subunit